MSVSFRLEEAGVSRSGFRDLFGGDGFLDFVEFVNDQFIVSVTVCVIFAQDIIGLLFSTLADKPSRTLRRPVNE